jgi:glyoxylase I family protein
VFENGSPGRIAAETKRLKKKGVQFTINPTDAGPVQIAIFSDTCGNFIQIYQPPQKDS